MESGVFVCIPLCTPPGFYQSVHDAFTPPVGHSHAYTASKLQPSYLIGQRGIPAVLSSPQFVLPTLVGIIKKIITNISHFFLLFPITLCVIMNTTFSLHFIFRVNAACTYILQAFGRSAGCWSSSKMCITCQTLCVTSVVFCLSRICREPLWAGHLPKQCALLHKVSTDLWAIYKPAACARSGCCFAAATDARRSSRHKSVFQEHINKAASDLHAKDAKVQQ